MNYTVETIEFTRPNSYKIEDGLRVSDDTGRAIVIDTDMNIVINCSYSNYHNDTKTFSTIK